MKKPNNAIRPKLSLEDTLTIVEWCRNKKGIKSLNYTTTARMASKELEMDLSGGQVARIRKSIGLPYVQNQTVIMTSVEVDARLTALETRIKVLEGINGVSPR